MVAQFFVSSILFYFPFLTETKVKKEKRLPPQRQDYTGDNSTQRTKFSLITLNLLNIGACERLVRF